LFPLIDTVSKEGAKPFFPLTIIVSYILLFNFFSY
jgi:hypothetical protein